MFNHYSVLLKEVLEGLNIKQDGIYVDATIGGAGHSSKICEHLSESGHLIGFDQDEVAIEASRQKLSNSSPQFNLIHKNFSYLKDELEKLGIKKIDGILFDLGVSSVQLDTKDRGFSYREDARLDMRMDTSSNLDAYQVINTYPLEKLSKIFFVYGEEKYGNRIASKIVEVRKNKPIETTFELVDIIKSCYPKKDLRDKHPAKKVFQAIRIEVNQELEVLKTALKDALDLLKVGGRCCVITFHSLEDRIVKEIFNEASTVSWNKNQPFLLTDEKAKFKLINKKPILPSDKELEENNRSHSAKLRIIERVMEG
ncbi:MAG: 16S rRNA (cytosine(1402)-N(4))-methyltransferase RsmH [Erysipelotrichaceae bacterium]|nr:16S rRNA (cytosine(1402)-N(4))-methyltransferase RsmH [Erysipelotrichaceae bacterium]